MNTYILNRKDVTKFLDDSLKSGDNIIVTGLDKSGKSTILMPFYSKYYILKNGINFSYWWADYDSKIFNYILNDYRLFDRHPAIDKLVYDNSKHRLTTEEVDNYFKSRKRGLDCIKNLNVTKAVVFLHDKYANEHTEYHEERLTLIHNFQVVCDYLSDYFDIYYVKD